jgi:hypothetical protein
MRRRRRGYHPEPIDEDYQVRRDENARILDDLPPAPPIPPPRAGKPVPARLNSPYYWNPWSLFSGLAEVLPILSPTAWKIVSLVAVRQIRQGLPAQDVSAPVAISLNDFVAQTGMSRVTVAAAIREAVDADWLSQLKSRTPHGGNAVARYSISWTRAVDAEKQRRKVKS